MYIKRNIKAIDSPDPIIPGSFVKMPNGKYGFVDEIIHNNKACVIYGDNYEMIVDVDTLTNTQVLFLSDVKRFGEYVLNSLTDNIESCNITHLGNDLYSSIIASYPVIEDVNTFTISFLICWADDAPSTVDVKYDNNNKLYVSREDEVFCQIFDDEIVVYTDKVAEKFELTEEKKQELFKKIKYNKDLEDCAALEYKYDSGTYVGSFSYKRRDFVEQVGTKGAKAFWISQLEESFKNAYLLGINSKLKNPKVWDDNMESDFQDWFKDIKIPYEL
jgi:hypothetical protein